MAVNKKVKLSEGEALKNKDAKGSDKKIQVWIPKSTIAYEEEKLKLQIELLKLQNHVKKTGQRIVMLFEGRDAAASTALALGGVLWDLCGRCWPTSGPSG